MSSHNICFPKNKKKTTTFTWITLLSGAMRCASIYLLFFYYFIYLFIYFRIKNHLLFFHDHCEDAFYTENGLMSY